MTEKFIYIGVNWAGRIILWEHNSRKCVCRMCSCEIEKEAGYRFKKTRFSNLQSGYVCRNCVAGFFRTCEKWSWNDWLGCLYPAIDESLHPHQGEELARMWLEGKLGETLK